mgnify:CR=1 FL=1|jgi:hypothetical protein
MATQGIQGLFGGMGTPEEMQRQLTEQKALQFSQMTPQQQTSYNIFKNTGNLGRGLAGAMGVDVQDPAVRQATMLRQLASQFDTNTPEGLKQMAQALQATNPELGMKVMQQAQMMEEQLAKTRGATAEAQKKELTVKQEAALRNELAALGPDATQDDILKAVTKYGSADKVMTVLQSAADKNIQREQAAQLQRERMEAQLQAQRERLDAQLEAAKDRGATAKEIAQMRIDSQQQIAGIMAGIRQQSMENKRAQDEEKRSDKLAKEEAQKQGVIASFDSSLDTLSRLASHPGKSSAVGFGGTTSSLIPGTNAAGFAAQLETFKAQTFLPQVQSLKGMGALSDAEGKRLTAAVGALDQKMKPAEFDAQLRIIENDLRKARARVTGAGTAGAPSSAPKATKRFNPATGQLEAI